MSNAAPEEVLSDYEKEVYGHVAGVWERYHALSPDERLGTYQEWEQTIIQALVGGCGLSLSAANEFCHLAYEETEFSTLDT
jgi:hypothetical protein